MSATSEQERKAQDVLALVADFMSVRRSWTGIASELHEELKSVAKAAGTYLPEEPAPFGFVLHRRKEQLRDLGVKIERGGRATGVNSGKRLIKLTRVKAKAKKASKPQTVSAADLRAKAVADGVAEFMKDKPNWVGTSRELFHAVKKPADSKKVWPVNVNVFSASLTLASRILVDQEIHLERRGRTVGLENQKLEQPKAEAAVSQPQLLVDLDVRKAQREAKTWKSQYEDAVRQIEEMRQQQEVLDSLPPPKDIYHIQPSKGRPGEDEAVAVFVTSDWHIEENVDPRTIEGLNEYTPDIARARLRKMWKSALKVIIKERGLSRIDTLVCAVIGDLITGFIHDELVESNWLHPLEALEIAQEELIAGLTFLADHGKFKKIYVPCCYGNHGRTTARRRVSTAAKNNYEWYMYRQVAQYFKGDDRFEFIVTDGYHITMDLLGTNVRFHHGDNVRYYGGVGGLSIPINKAVQSWNKNNPNPADFDVMGHYHSVHFLPDALVNGSVIGYNAYAQSIKARYEEPQQTLFLIAKEHGPTCFNRIWVT